MPESFILALLLLGLAVLVLAASPLIARFRFTEKRRTARGYGIEKVKSDPIGFRFPILVTIGLVLLAGLFTANASFNKVALNNVGIVTYANKPVGDVTGPGYHWVEPYKKIEEWDANYERWDHLSEKNTAQVLIAGLQPARLEIAVDYAPDKAQAPQQFQDYKRNIELWRANRALPSITAAVNSAFADFDPLVGINPETGQIKTPDLAPYQEKVKQAILAALPGEIRVKAVQIGFIHYSDETTKQINARAAKLLEAGNLKLDKANQDLKNSITEKKAAADPTTRCMDIAAANGTPPGLCGLLTGNGNASVLVGTGK
jgi:SPFH domain/Band 7 family protein